MDVPRVPRGRNVNIMISVNSEDINLQRSGSPRRVNQGFSAYANFRKMNWKKVQASMPNANHSQISSESANMWKKTSSEEKIRTRVRSPRKVRKVRMSKTRALKKSGSPRRARKDKGTKRTGVKLTAYNLFVKKYSAAKKTALGTNNQRMVLKALAVDWRAGIRSY